MTTQAVFFALYDNEKRSALDRAKALLWFAGTDDASIGLSAGEICRVVEAAGHAKQNASRLDRQLSGAKRQIVKGAAGTWRLSPAFRASLDKELKPLLGRPRAVTASDGVIPASLFNGTRGYIEKVVFQINASYDAGLYDCTTVMCRRLLETLIIEVYEHVGRSAHIKNTSGHFLMLADLVAKVTADTSLNVSRNGLKALDEFKKLGDLSAHNRRFNAKREDIDRTQGGLRVVSEELLHLAKLI